MVGSKKNNHLLCVLYTILLNIQYVIICKSNSKSQIMGTPNTRYYLIQLQLIFSGMQLCLQTTQKSTFH